MKNTKKNVAVAYTVDLTNIETVDDVCVAFVNAKVNAGEVIRPYELYMYVGAYEHDAFGPIISDAKNAFTMFDNASTYMLNAVTNYIEKKNTPWYKKIWRKVTGLFHRD